MVSMPVNFKMSIIISNPFTFTKPMKVPFS
uniref:Uncharacterized protein n=1 Tax=Arundo donax TaxID=35708 RepID=A0A0A9BLS8_ARUDO